MYRNFINGAISLFILKNLRAYLSGKKIILNIFLILFVFAGLNGQQTELTFQTGHVAAINKIAFSPDGNFLASSDDQHKICIWDMTCLTQMTSFYYSDLEEKEIISLLAFSKDNTKLIAGTATGNLIIWDIAKSVKISTLSIGRNISGVLFVDNTIALLSSSSLLSLDITDNSIKEIYNKPVADLVCDMKNRDLVFGTSNGEFGKILTQNGLEVQPDENAKGDLKKVVSGKYLGDFSMKIGSNGFAISSGFLIYFYNFPDQKKLFSASMPYMDEVITDLDFLPHDNYYIASTTDGKIYVYDFQKNKLIKVLRDHVSEVNSLAVHPSKNIFASGSSDRSIILWDAATLTPIKRFYARASSIETLELNEANQLLSFGNELGYTKLIKLTDKYPEIKSVRNHKQKLTDILFTEGGRSIITSSNDNHLSKLNSDNLSIEKYRKFKKNFGFSYLLSNIMVKLNLYVDPNTFIDSVALSHDQTYVIADGYKMKNKTVKSNVIKNGVTTRKKKRELISYKYKYEYCYSLPGLKKIKVRNPQRETNISGVKIDSLIMGVDVYNKKNGHISGITGAVHDKTFNRLITSSMDATIKVWDLGTKKLVVTIIPVDKNKRIFITADNYYFAPKNSLDAIGFKQGINFYPLEQFDLKFNRPDIVLSQLKNPDTLLIKMYKNAYEKRLKKSGFDEKMFSADWHTPEMEILNSEEFGYTIDKPQMQLKISGSDSKYKLDRLNIWINDVPLYGTNGMSLRSEISDTVVKTLTIPLSAGNNRIQVSCMNEKGVESLKRSVDIAYNSPVTVKPDLYVIAMSVSEYQDNRYNLQYAVKDGKDIANMFNPQSVRQEEFNAVHFDTLFNKMATKENFFKIKNRLLNSKADDQVVVFVSGHGLLNKDLDFYFATYDIDFSNPEKRGISFDDMEHLLDSIPARKKLMMMDACHSGEVDKAEPSTFVAQNIESTSDITFRGNIKEYNFKGVNATATQSGTNLNSSFELMQELFAGLDKGTGTVVISAAAGKGYALESSKWNNGVFTYSIINGLKNKAADKNKDKKITISELKNYSISQVEQLTGGNQKPTARREALGIDWRIW
jgi:WD40 repeat protein